MRRTAAAEPPEPQGSLRLEHFAFSASGLPEFLEQLLLRGVIFRQSRQAGTGSLIVNLHDPDGNRIHVDFPVGDV